VRRVVILLIMLPLIACGGAETREEPETVIGTPPSPKDDPFFFVAMPAEAVPAATQGTIGDDETAPAAAATSAENSASSTGGVECFSCVRICPEGVSDADCGAEYDTICGWGKATDRNVAAEIATGECDAALDMARAGGRYSTISGSCPAATCR
jgi:hypothetical protein